MKTLIAKYKKYSVTQLTKLLKGDKLKATEKVAINTILKERNDKSKTKSAPKKVVIKKAVKKVTSKKEKEKESKPKKVGVIKTIYNLIDEKGPISNVEILNELSKVFPERDKEAMNRTLKIQIMSNNRPARMERDSKRTFDVVIDTESKTKTFSFKKNK